MPKFIVVTGGVLSGLGKGIAAASIGHLLSKNFKVVPMKLDGYLNTDPGTMNPQEHGEVFVLDDGSEVDMDFGHYERYLNCICTKNQSVTMGKIFAEVQAKERKGDYLGKTVQLIPHVTDLIKEKFELVAKNQDADIVIIEVGGTVGDIENELFIEAARQLAAEVGRKNSMFIHLTHIPIPGGVKEQKTKPTQQSVKLLLERGVMPDMIIARCKEPVQEHIKEKISIFCNVKPEAVISGHDVDYVYEIPENFDKQNVLKLIGDRLDLKVPKSKSKWPPLVQNLKHPEQNITIAVCGKYTALEDSYASIKEALCHCSANTKTKIIMRMIETTHIKSKEDAEKVLEDVDGIIVPGGFGNRGTEGKIEMIKYARENNLPFLGICLGLQLSVIEFARNVCGIADATSEEFKKTAKNQVIKYIPGQHEDIEMGGTMRLGAYKAILDKKSKVYKDIYKKKEEVYERHRHRYEVNPDFHKTLQDNGLNLAGFSPDGRLVEFICLEDHSFFVATQGHPELKSKFEDPAPLFFALSKAAIKRKHG